jgi:predicted alpha/beta superfamily hydrolase
MIRKLLFVLLVLLGAAPALAGDPQGPVHVSAGTIVDLGVVQSKYTDPRRVVVWLPPGYGAHGPKHAVLYMHDGQNLFDPETSYAGDWGVDDTLEALAGEGLEAIVVGIPNAGERRLDEYGPFPDPAMGGGRAADYLGFVIDTVKPLVDASFRTTGEAARTATIGSSMGGLVSLYAHFARPDVFGLAGAFSPSIGFGHGAMLRFLREAPHVAGRIYLDVGARERMSPLVHEARNVLVEKGYRTGKELLFVEDVTGGHDEASWARRLPPALRFLLA